MKLGKCSVSGCIQAPPFYPNSRKMREPVKSLAVFLIGSVGNASSWGDLNVVRHEESERIWYPASGVLHQAGFGLGDEFEYRFEVTNVSRLPEDAEDSWWIQWPEGTIVNDQVEKRNYTIGIQP